MTAPIGGVSSGMSQQLIDGLQGGGGTSSLGSALNIGGENGVSTLPGVGGGDSFGETLRTALGEVSKSQEHAQDYIQRYVRGEPVELHQVMAATEEAGIALEVLVE